MISNNQSTWISALTSILMVVGTYLVASGKVTSDQWSAQSKAIVDAAVLLIPVGIGIYKLLPHSNANKVEAASTVPGVEVTVAPNAAPAVVAVAKDPTNAVKLL